MALLAWTAFECFGPTPTQGIAASTYDQMQQRRLWASAPDPRLLIVDIDERSLADMAGEFGRWPWPRDTLATVLEHSQRQGAAAVVFDVLFSDPDRLRPGGDHALEAAVRASTRSFFPVLRLPAALDAQSELRADAVPGLARPGTGAPPRVAAVIPFMHTMLNSQRLGTHTAHLDGDGKIRRFALHEDLPGGWQLRSIPAAVAQHLGVSPQPDATPRLVVWRQQAQAYPRVPFSVVWACAEGQQRADCPVLAGRILLVGATASSLHDIKTTPLASQHMGVDILATLIDNALHQRHYTELPPAARWALCVAALALAWGVVRRGRAGASTRALWLLPSALMAIGWASLHSERYFLDLTLPAGSALTFLSFVALFDKWRRHHLGGTPCAGTAIVCASASMHAEPLERAVLDAAALHGARVTGATSTSGEHGQTHTVWVLWRLPDAAVARALSVQLPAAWCRVFDAGTDPLRAQLLAMAQALPAPASANTPPRESHLAST
jgi:adenylate cyclase